MHFRFCAESGRSAKINAVRSFPLFIVALLLCLAPAAASAQKLSCRPGSSDFGKVRLGKSGFYSFLLENPSGKPVTIRSTSIQGKAFSLGNFPLPLTIDPKSSVSLPVIFIPADDDEAQGFVTIKSNAKNSPLKVAVSGKGAGKEVSGPQLAVSPPSLSFGSVPVGSNSTAQATLTASNAAVTITSDASTNAEFSILGLKLPVTIQAGQNLPVTIQFTPSASGNASGKAQFTSNADNSPTVENLTGSGVAQQSRELTISPPSLNFGNVTVGSSATLQATLTAPDGSVTISSDQVSSQFAILGMSLPVTIQAGQSLPVTIQFSPSASGTASGTAQFSSNADNSPSVENLTGTGVAQTNRELSISPSTLAFGNVSVGSSASLQATLTAPDASVTISSDQVSSEFAIVGISLPVTIKAGQSLPVTIQFSPSASGAASGQAQFISNAENSPTVASLTGNGVAQTNRELTISPSTLDFGNVTVGSSAKLQATLTAPDDAVTISSDRVSSEFAILGLSLPVTIKAGQSLPVTIQFSPGASGGASGKAQFTSNAENSPTTEVLSGTGVGAGSHSVSLSWDPGDGNAVGYNIYRTTSQGGPYEIVNTALDSSTDYTDSAVVSGTTYFYVTTEVNAKGQESPYSNVAKAVIPQ
jgi:Abnormal spindle-like microcephaly-assoc'd, ASPM-SPD-2-Hydin